MLIKIQTWGWTKTKMGSIPTGRCRQHVSPKSSYPTGLKAIFLRVYLTTLSTATIIYRRW